MSEERLLEQLSPPSGGWQQLQKRRDAGRSVRGHVALPIAAAAMLLLVMVFLRPQPRDVQLPWSGGRLVAQVSEGVVLRETQGRATALRSDDPRVRFYWLQQSAGPPQK